MKQLTGSRLLAGTRLKSIAQLLANVPPVRLVVSSVPHEEGVELRTPHTHKPLPHKLMPLSTSNTTCDLSPPMSMSERKRCQLSAIHPLPSESSVSSGRLVCENFRLRDYYPKVCENFFKDISGVAAKGK